ncbi:MAG: hypothetical protein ACXWT1_04095 [Methylobacter sp.]
MEKSQTLAILFCRRVDPNAKRTDSDRRAEFYPLLLGLLPNLSYQTNDLIMKCPDLKSGTVISGTDNKSGSFWNASTKSMGERNV